MAAMVLRILIIFRFCSALMDSDPGIFAVGMTGSEWWWFKTDEHFYDATSLVFFISSKSFDERAVYYPSNTSISDSRCPVESFHSNSRAHAMRRTPLDTLSTVTFAQEKYVVVKRCLIYKLSVSFLISVSLKCEPWSVTSQLISPKSAIHFPRQLWPRRYLPACKDRARYTRSGHPLRPARISDLRFP